MKPQIRLQISNMNTYSGIGNKLKSIHIFDEISVQVHVSMSKYRVSDMSTRRLYEEYE